MEYITMDMSITCKERKNSK